MALRQMPENPLPRPNGRHGKLTQLIYRRTEQCRQMRRGSRRLITEIRRVKVEKPARYRHFGKSIPEKTGIGHARHATARAVAMTAAVGIGRAILARVNIIARVVRRRCAVVLVCQPEILMSAGYYYILNPFRAMRGKWLRR